MMVIMVIEWEIYRQVTSYSTYSTHTHTHDDALFSTVVSI